MPLSQKSVYLRPQINFDLLSFDFSTTKNLQFNKSLIQNCKDDQSRHSK